MQTKNCFDVSLYKRMLAGQLPAAEAETLCQHLEQCDQCFQTVRNLPEDTLVASMRAKGPWPTTGVDSAFVHELVQKVLQKSGQELLAPMVFACPGCGKHLQVKKELAGQKVKCPKCGKIMQIPVPVAKLLASVTDTSRDGAVAETLPPKDVRPPTAVEPPAKPANPPTVAPVPKEVTNPSHQLPMGLIVDTMNDRSLIDFLAPPQQPDEIGRLGGYRVLKVLGAGGMGVVYKAEDPGLKRLVAIKAMLPAIAAGASARLRFLREAQAAAAIKHNHVVTIHQVGEAPGTLGSVPFLAMEFLAGESLEHRLQRETTLPLAETLRIGREMAEGMTAAHELGLIHRDIKPANTWLEGKKSHVKVLDFGLARSTTEQANLTQSGAIIGTPAYMAPEQARGEKVDARVDLWSLGVVLYRMCTGLLPFKGNDTVSMLMAVALNTPTPPSQVNAAVPAGLSDLVLKLLEKDPAKRPGSAQEVVEALRDLEQVRQAHAAQAISAQNPKPQGEVLRTLGVSPVKPPGFGVPHPGACVSGSKGTARRQLWPYLAAGVLGAAVLAFVAFQIIRVETENGTLVVEINDPNVEVLVKMNGVQVQDKTQKREFQLKAGKGVIEVFEKDGVGPLQTKEFALNSGGKTTVTVTLEPRPAQAKSPDTKKDPVKPPAIGEQPVDLLKLIDPRTVSIVQKYEVFENSHNPPTSTAVRAVAISRDGKRVLTVTAPPNGMGTPILWDAGSGKKIQTFPEVRVSERPAVTLSGDGKRILTISLDHNKAIAILWEAESGTKIQSFEVTGHFPSVALSGDGKLVVIASVSSDQSKSKISANGSTLQETTAILWETASGKKIQTFEGHSGLGSALAMSPDGKHILTSDDNNGPTAILWEAATAKKIQTFQDRGVGVDEVALSDDGKLVLIRGVHGGQTSAILWDAASGKKIRAFKGDKNEPFFSAAISGDGKLVLTGFSGSAAILWEAASGKKIHTFTSGKEGNWSLVALSGDGRRLLIDSTLWEIKGSLEPRNNSIVQKYHVHAANVQSVALSGRHILTGSADKTAILWDAVTGKNLHCFQGHAGIVWSVALSADAKHALTGSEDKTAILWDAVSNKKLQTFEGHSDQVISVALSGDRQHVLTGSLDKTAILWEAVSGKKLQTLRGHAGQIQSVALCGSGGDNKFVLTGSDDKTAILWDAASGKKLQEFEGHVGGVTSVAVSGDGKRVLTGSADKAAILWEAASGKKLQTFKGYQVKPGVGPMIGHTGAVNCVALSDDGRLVLTGSDDKTAILWEAASGKILQTFEGHAGEVYAVTMRGDGKIVVTGSKDQSAILWEVKASPGQ